MEITGVLIKKLGESAGTSEKTGMPWRNAEFLMEIPGQYKKHVNFKVRDGQYNLIQRFENLLGMFVTVSFEIEAHEGKDGGRWFNEVRAWGIVEYKAGQVTAEESMRHKDEIPFEDMMQKDAVAGMAQMLNEEKEHGKDDEELPF